MKSFLSFPKLSLILSLSLTLTGIELPAKGQVMPPKDINPPHLRPINPFPTSPSTNLDPTIPLLTTPSHALPLSPGDQVRILIQDGDLFNGVYEVNTNGELKLPYLSSINVVGLDLDKIQQILEKKLVEEKLFQPGYAKVSVSIVKWAEIEVSVSGAVFQPGFFVINTRSAETQALQNNVVSGDYAPERTLIAALRAAGGITPKANIREIILFRNDQEYKFDLSGVFDGLPVDNVFLVKGDQITVPQLDTWQNHLVRPSAITIPALQIRISNLTVPANSNSSSSLDREAITFPYGARFSQAVVSGNCVGGTETSNASRKAILVRTDRQTGVTKVYERSIEDLMRNSTDETNPFLMPDDGVACYDSTVTEVRDVAQTLLQILTPINIIKDIFGF